MPSFTFCYVKSSIETEKCFRAIGGEDRAVSARPGVMPETVWVPLTLPAAWGPRVGDAVPASAPPAGLAEDVGGPTQCLVGSGPRMIQEEKESAELRAEEIETRVTSGSMEALNLTQLRKRGSIPTSLTALSLASASPPLSGRSTPKLTSRSAAQDLDRMGVMTLVRVWRQLMNSPVGSGLCSGGWLRVAEKLW